MKKIFFGLLFLTPILLRAQYNALFIPDSLKKGANMVVRYEETILEIKSLSKATVKKRHVYTVLNETAAKYGGYNSYYNKFTSINYISGTLYNAIGKEVKHIKKKDMQDLSGDDDASLMEDTRYKVHDFYCREYPYTIVYEEEDELHGLLFFPNWYPIKETAVGVENSKYTIIAPKDYLVRYKPLNCPVQPVITETNDKKIYTWEIKNLPVINTESYGPSWREKAPVVLFAPSDFEAEGYKGNMSTWQDYGKFIGQLYNNRDVLPDNIKKTVHDLTDLIKNPKEKVTILYNYLQKNTRYISIQLGIGGWQPFDATFVATKKYGDCKALSNYMVALLKEAGIKANSVIVFSGDAMEKPLIESFSSFSQFNHAISCVPIDKDTIWLECTSSTQSAGYMGHATGNRKAILINDDGGHIVNTPSYAVTDNQQIRIVDAVIDADGNLDATVNTKYTGIKQDFPHALIHEVSKEWREKYLNRTINLPTYQVDKTNYEEIKGRIPQVKEFLHVTSPGYANITGKRLFIAPNLFNKTYIRFSPDSLRKYDIVFDDVCTEIDSIVIAIPTGYTAEALPQNINIDNEFGKYAITIKVENNKILYVRNMVRSCRRFSATKYTELVKFQEQMYKADRNKLVLVKKE